MLIPSAQLMQQQQQQNVGLNVSSGGRLPSSGAPASPAGSLGSAHLDWSQFQPVVIFCNPNAGYYETMVYQDDWLQFYTTR